MFLPVVNTNQQINLDGFAVLPSINKTVLGAVPPPLQPRPATSISSISTQSDTRSCYSQGEDLTLQKMLAINNLITNSFPRHAPVPRNSSHLILLAIIHRLGSRLTTINSISHLRLQCAGHLISSIQNRDPNQNH